MKLVFFDWMSILCDEKSLLTRWLETKTLFPSYMNNGIRREKLTSLKRVKYYILYMKVRVGTKKNSIVLSQLERFSKHHRTVDRCVIARFLVELSQLELSHLKRVCKRSISGPIKRLSQFKLSHLKRLPEIFSTQVSTWIVGTYTRLDYPAKKQFCYFQ